MKYVGKQKALAFAVMAMLVGSSAQAALLDLTASPLATVPASAYAKEIKFDDTQTQNLQEIPNGSSFSVKFSFGPGGAGNDVYVRLTLSSGQWNPALVGSYANPTSVTTTGSVKVDLTGSSVALLAATDVKADTYVSADDPKGLIVHITSPNVVLVAGDVVTVSFNQALVNAGAVGAAPGTNLNVIQSTATNKITGTVTLTKSLHATAFNANTNNEGTNKVTGSYVGFESSVFDNTAVTAPGSSFTIDVLQNSLEFTGLPTIPAAGGTAQKYTAELCSFDVKEGTGLLLNGAAANATGDIEAVTTGSVIKVEGKFASLGGEKGRLYLTTAVDCNAEAAGATSGVVATNTATTKIASTLTSSEATFALDNKWAANFVTGAAAGAAGVPGPVSLCFASNGTTPIEAGVVSVSYVPVANSGYKLEQAYSLGTCATLDKNGSTASVPMVVNVASPWTQYMRVTNPSTQAGKVLITAYDDKGVKGSKVYSFDLAAGASTGLISVQNILDGTGAAALTETATVGNGALNKLRLSVEAEFGSGHNGSSTDGVVVRTYVLPNATTGGAFTQFQ